MARSKYTKHQNNSDAATSPDDADDVFVSRSAKKRESDAMKALGVELAELSTRQLKELGLSDTLFKAIIDYQGITSNSAKRRQRGFVGGLLRDDIDEAEAIRARYIAMTQHDADAKRVHHELEDWRERLIASDAALTEFLNKYGAGGNADATNANAEFDATPDSDASRPDISPQELRTLIRRVRTAKDDAQRKKRRARYTESSQASLRPEFRPR